MQGLRRKHSCSSRNSTGATYRREVPPLRRTQKVSAFRNLPRQALSFPLEEAGSHCRRQDGVDRCSSGPHNRRRLAKKIGACVCRLRGIRCSRVRLLRSSLPPFLPVLSWPSSRSSPFPLGKLLAHCRADHVRADVVLFGGSGGPCRPPVPNRPEAKQPSPPVVSPTYLRRSDG